MSSAAVLGRPLRVCYFGTYRAAYSRNRILIEGLKRNGVEVTECHEPLWHSEADRVEAVKGKWRSPGFWRRVLVTYCRLLRKYCRTVDDYDVLVVGYPGQFDVYLAKLLACLRGRPLAWDVLMSLYLIVVERGLAQQAPLVANAMHAAEWAAVRLPDRMFLDSSAYIRWFAAQYDIPANRFRLLPTGADSDRFHPAYELRSTQCAGSEAGSGSEVVDGPFRVVYHGTFLGTHGIETIVEAARLLRAHTDIRFTLVGDGPRRAEMQKLAFGLENVTFAGWVEEATLRDILHSADVSLGAFGVTPQSYLSVQHKVYEGMALGKAVVTADGPAVCQFFEHGKHLYLAGRADPVALASAIVILQTDTTLRRTLAEEGHRLYREEYSIEKLGRRYKTLLLEMVRRDA